MIDLKNWLLERINVLEMTMTAASLQLQQSQPRAATGITMSPKNHHLELTPVKQSAAAAMTT